jgi:uncharacterized protein (UPF0332 family)
MKKLIDELKANGFIAQEEIGFDQIIRHLDRANKDVRVAKANLKIDMEAAYNYAYLATLRTGRALMFSFGYRPTDGQQHKTIVLFSGTILGKEFSVLVAKFDRMRKFRNKFTYEEPGILVSLQEAEKAIMSASQFVTRVSDFIQKKNPQMKLL